MRASIENISPNSTFWNDYASLWNNSIGRSPFQSPHLLRFFAGECRGEVLAFQFFLDGELKGAAVFMRGKKEYGFLSDLKTDHNFFVIDRCCTDNQVGMFFGHFLEEIKRKKWALLLNNQPGWSPYMCVFLEKLKEGGLFWKHLPYSVCPVMEAGSPEDLFKHIHGIRKIRYPANRMATQLGAKFEALTGGEDIDSWADQFTETHIRRWNGTPTPSSFRDPGRIQFLKNCLHAWQKDGILVRFSLRIDELRVGYVVGLRQEETLVFHSTTYDPDFKKYSPGLAIIYSLGEWMKEQQMHVLDFGDGNEAYKYTVANKEQELSRIFISGSSNVFFILKTIMIRTVRKNAELFDFYRLRLKPLAKSLLHGKKASWPTPLFLPDFINGILENYDFSIFAV